MPRNVFTVQATSGLFPPDGFDFLQIGRHTFGSENVTAERDFIINLRWCERHFILHELLRQGF